MAVSLVLIVNVILSLLQVTNNDIGHIRLITVKSSKVYCNLMVKQEASIARDVVSSSTNRSSDMLH